MIYLPELANIVVSFVNSQLARSHRVKSGGISPVLEISSVGICALTA